MNIPRRFIMNFEELSLAVQKGKAKQVKELVNQGIDEGVSVEEILNKGLISAMGIVGDNFKNNKIYVPEMLVAARAMSAGLTILEPLLTATGVKPIGKVVIGTVKGDLHDIGKNLVVMMLKGIGATVYDLGIDVPDSAFVEKAEEVNADIVCLSALLTTTMPAMGDVVREFEKAGVRNKYRIMVGGAPVNQAFAESIGADAYSPNASAAADSVKEYLESLK
jgi:corrinoid protein of di/trimethylamine methyltransferase